MPSKSILSGRRPRRYRTRTGSLIAALAVTLGGLAGVGVTETPAQATNEFTQYTPKLRIKPSVTRHWKAACPKGTKIKTPPLRELSVKAEYTVQSNPSLIFVSGGNQNEPGFGSIWTDVDGRSGVEYVIRNNSAFHEEIQLRYTCTGTPDPEESTQQTFPNLPWDCANQKMEWCNTQPLKRADGTWWKDIPVEPKPFGKPAWACTEDGSTPTINFTHSWTRGSTYSIETSRGVTVEFGLGELGGFKTLSADISASFTKSTGWTWSTEETFGEEYLDYGSSRQKMWFEAAPAIREASGTFWAKYEDGVEVYETGGVNGSTYAKKITITSPVMDDMQKGGGTVTFESRRMTAEEEKFQCSEPAETGGIPLDSPYYDGTNRIYGDSTSTPDMRLNEVSSLRALNNTSTSNGSSLYATPEAEALGQKWKVEYLGKSAWQGKPYYRLRSMLNPNNCLVLPNNDIQQAVVARPCATPGGRAWFLLEPSSNNGYYRIYNPDLKAALMSYAWTLAGVPDASDEVCKNLAGQQPQLMYFKKIDPNSSSVCGQWMFRLDKPWLDL
ncbi:hypothetical protein [Streptomyces sp. TRM64462]|uniref:hypothetical protein n=1 Tax=Streptomyces sp. TRM64462 TaxID=2741726 RepID=UPI0015860549|nr:hypothetical protein [Streptomyces sp. TRM64462]